MDHDGDVDATDIELQAEADDLAHDAGRIATRLHKDVVVDADGVPERLRWRPTVSWKAMALGALTDVAVEVILHQAGLILFETRDLIEGIVQGSILGALVPMMGNLVGTIWVNGRITRLRQRTGVPA